MSGEGAGDVGIRRRILSTVIRYPGLHLREIQRKVSTSARLAEYHLNALEELGLVTSREEGGYRRFFPTRQEEGALDEREKRWLGLLRQQVPFGVVLHLLEHGTARHSDLVDVVPVSKSTLSHHVSKLEDAGLVERQPAGRNVRLSDPETVREMLQTHDPLPDLVSSYGEMWEAIFDAFRGGEQAPD